jgi:hypothetical protein
MTLKTPGKSTRRIVIAITLMFAVTALVSVLSGGVLGQATDTHPDCSEVSYAGEGTENSPYQITSAAQLQCIQEDLDASYELKEDINAGKTSSWNGGEGFEPIEGETKVRFSGRLDGNGHTISGLTIARDGNNGNVALFRTVTGVVESLRFSRANITATESASAAVVASSNAGLIQDVTVTGSSVSTAANVGGLVAVFNGFPSDELDSAGTIEDVKVSGTVSGGAGGGVVSDSLGGAMKHITANVTLRTTQPAPTAPNTGGIVGTATNTSVENVTVNADIEADSLAGGVAGETAGTTITGAQVSGEVRAEPGGDTVGGLVAEAARNSAGVETTIQDSLVRAVVEGSNSVGGIVGASTGNLTQVQFNGTVTGTNAVGGAVGNNFGPLSEVRTDGSVNGNDIVGGLTGVQVNTLKNSYSLADVDGQSRTGGAVGKLSGQAIDVFAAGTVAGRQTTGGLVGSVNRGGVTDAYWDTNATGLSNSAAGTPRATSQMTGASAETSLSLNFGGTWETTSSYPELVTFTTPSPVLETPPEDTDDDGLYEDVRGDGEFNILDVQTLFNNLNTQTVQKNSRAFNFAPVDEEITVLDIQALFTEMRGESPRASARGGSQRASAILTGS